MKKFKIINICITMCIILGTLVPNVSALAIAQLDRAGTSSFTSVLFEDENFNSIQDADESSLPGVTVRLLDANQAEIANVKTDANGKYSFDNLSAGDYYIKIDAPDNYEMVTSGSSAKFNNKGLSKKISLGDGVTFTDAWIGYMSLQSKIRGTVFEDINKNGKKESNELGIPEIELGLFQVGMSTPVKTLKTDSDGKYAFKEIVSNNAYEVKILSLPTKYQVIENKNFDKTGKSIAFNVISSQNLTNIDLALFEEIDVTDITVEPTELNQIVGDTGQLKVTVLPENATDKTVTYESKDSSIITVDAEGKWEAKKAGTTEITVKSGGKTVTVKVTVKEKNVPVEKLTVEPTELNQIVGDTGQLKVTVLPENATDKTVTYESKDSSIITVNAEGKWEAKKAGTTEITVKSGEKTVTVKVIVKDKDILVDNITVEPKILDQYVGDTGKLKVSITPENATDKTVTYTSAEPSIIIVDSSGNWIAKAAGTTEITVKSSNGKTEKVAVIVREKNIPLVDISVEPKSLDQYVGDKGKLKVTFNPNNATNKDVTFTSGDTKIITVDAEGNWEAKAVGKTVIIVTGSNGKMSLVQVMVKEKDIPVTEITVEPKVLDQYVGDKGKLKVTFNPDNATNKDVTFTSGDTKIITVDAEGNWEAKSVGTTVIVVMTDNGKMAMINVTVKEKDIPIESIAIEPKVLDQYVGDTGTLKVIYNPSNATNKNVTFTSGDPSVMTVDDKGNWEAKAIGKTVIVATSATGEIAMVQVTVKAKDIPVESITVEPKFLDQYVGDTGKLKVTFNPDNATNKNVIFTSGDPSIITIDDSGSWIAHKPGTTTIIVTTSNGKTIIVPVKVKESETPEVPLESITIEPKILDQYVGDTGTLKVIYNPSNATNKNVTFTSGDPSIMTVDAEGNWEAKTVGKTVIIVTSATGKMTMVQVTVKEKNIPVESITVEPNNLDQYVGDKGKLKVIYNPTNATNKNVTFTSADPSIMTVDAEGNWEAKAVGKTIIIVTSASGKMTMVHATVKEKDIPIESIIVEPKALDQYVGDSGTLKVSINPNNATDKTITFTSSDSSIMSIDAQGNWKAKAAGKTTIVVATSNGKTIIVPVTVKEREAPEVPLESITVDPKELNQYVGDKGTLTVNFNPSNATNKNVTFTSIDPSIITVDTSGNWEAKAVGTTSIIVMTSNGKMTIVKVSVKEKDVPVESITIEPKELNQYIGDKGALKVIYNPSNATNKNATFTSADPSIMTVDAEGNWEAKTVGRTVIIVTSENGKTVLVQVTVKAKDIPVESITVEPKSLNQYVGDMGTLKVTITPDNATNKNVSYTSADPSIMTVDDKGNWVAQKVGFTTIIVTTSNGKTAMVPVTVKEREIPDVPVESITVEPKELNQLVGDKGTLKVTFNPSNATNKNLTFTSADPSIMTVDDKGNWEAKAARTTMIIITTSNGKMVMVSVKVREKDIPVESITTEPKELDQYVGDKGTLNVIFNPSNATNKNVTYRSTDPSIITIDANGHWEAKAVGRTTIFVMTENGKFAVVQVNVKERDIPVDSITVDPKSLDQFVGDTGKLNVTILPDNATNKTVTFRSTDPSIMTVDDKGNWEAKAPGQTTIIVTTSNGKTSVVNVTVNKKISQGVSVSYYDYPKFLGMFELKGTGTATNFDDNYGKQEPYPGLGTDNYKVTKVGYVKITETGLYKFSMAVDDNATVYIDNEQVLKRDTVVGGSLSNTRYLTAGQTIKIQTEHYHKISSNSYFQLRWWKPSNPYSPVPIPDSEIMMEN